MKKLLAALFLSLPFAAAYAQEPADSLAVDTVADPYEQFYGMEVNKVYNQGLAYNRKFDFDNALLCFQYCAEQGLALAQYQVGVIYFNGTSSYGKDDAKAVEYWIMAADQNNLSAQFYLGNYYYTVEDYANALKYWELSVENGGDPATMNNIGKCYDEGKGVDCDEEMALTWYTRAAALGNKEAPYNIGTFYEMGKAGLTPDNEKAIEWYKKAAGLGYEKAKLALERLQ